MRTLVLMIGVAMTLGASIAEAQTTGRFEQITVSTTAIGISSSTFNGMSGCAIVTETAAIRMRYDGTNPTASVGTPIPAGGAYVFSSVVEAQTAKMIRSGGSDATAWVSCWPSSGDAVPVGASGSSGGGGGGGDVNLTQIAGVTLGSSSLAVLGTKTNNNAAPGATNIGALIGVANAAAPTWAEGNMVGGSFDLSGALRVAGSTAFTQYTQDAALTVGTSVGGMAMGRASAAAPTDVSADNDAVLPWYLRSGAQATALTAAGALIGGDATNGIDVDVTRVTGTVTVAGAKTNNNAAPGATNIGALIGIANAAAPTWAEGNMVGGSFDLSGALRVAGSTAFTQYTQDAALTVATTVGGMAMGRASAAAPTDVSADNDAVIPWYLRSGANVTQPTFGGVLAVAGNGASGTGVQRVTLANDSTGVIATVGAVTTITNNVNTIGTIANDAGAAGTNRIPTLPGITENAAPTRTDGRNAALSLTTGGAARVMITNSAGTASTLATDQTLDAAIGTTGPLMTGRGSAATPTAMSADNDSTALWLTLNGAAHVAVEGIEDAAETAAAPLAMAGSVRRDVAASSAGTTGDNATVNTDAVGLLWTRQFDACSAGAKTTTPISLTARTVIISASASNKNYICSISIVAGTAEIFNLVEGTGTTCQTGTAALIGSTTAANGMSFAANGGMAAIGGAATVIAPITANVDTCIVPSGSNRLSGFVTWIQRP